MHRPFHELNDAVPMAATAFGNPVGSMRLSALPAQRFVVLVEQLGGVRLELLRVGAGRDRRVVIAGNLDDTPDSPTLAAFAANPELGLVNALQNPRETRQRPPDPGDPPPAFTAWTRRVKESGQPARYELFDQLWFSPAIATRQPSAWTGCRTRLGGDGFDHDLA